MHLRRRRKLRSRQFESLEERYLLSTITVTSLADNMDVDGEVTLREAIHAANTDTSVDGSTRGDSDDAIQFDPSLAGGTISLQMGELQITDDLKVKGSDVEIDAGSTSRLFEVSADVDHFELFRVVLRNGFHSSSGGAIHSDANELVLNRTKFIGNSVRGDGDRLTGGAVDATNVSVLSALFRANSVEYVGVGEAGADVSGGALFAVNGSVKSSRFLSNASSGTGGGMTFTEKFEIQNSEASGNRAPIAGAGVFFNQPDNTELWTIGYSSIAKSTITGNDGSGVATDAVSSLSIRETQVSDNSSHGIEIVNAAQTAYASSIDQSVIRSNGGSGVYMHPDVVAGLSVFTSEVADNQGFGMKAGPHAKVYSSTISGNLQGGLQGTAHDEQAFRYINTFRITDSTISGNKSSSGPAAIDLHQPFPSNNPPVARLDNSTVVGNVSGAGFTPIGSSLGPNLSFNQGLGAIVAHNTDTDGKSLDVRCGMDLPALGCEFVWSVVGVLELDFPEDYVDRFVEFRFRNSKFGLASSPLDPAIGALVQHDHYVPTHPLMPGSPAIGLREDRDAGAMQSGSELSDELTLSVNDVSANEGSGELVFNAWVSSLPEQGVASATFVVRNGSAEAGKDFEDIGHVTVTFDPTSPTRQQIAVPLPDDVLVEADKSFTLEVVDSEGFDSVTESASGTILNDDVVRVSINSDPVTIVEGNGGRRRMRFEVAAEEAKGQPFSVRVRTFDRTASASDGDYIPVDEVLNFTGRPGQTRTVVVQVPGDNTIETHERFGVEISLHPSSENLPNLEIGNAIGSGVIVNNDRGVGVHDRQLVVMGSQADDAVTFGDAIGNALLVELNGEQSIVPISDFDSIFVDTFQGNDSVIWNDGLSSPITIELGDGNDRVFLSEAFDADATVHAGPGDDIVRTGHGKDEVVGGSGNDTLSGGWGGTEGDTLIGGAGDDELTGGAGNDFIDGDSGNDQIFGADGDDTLHGATGSDTIYGQAGDDSVDAGAGSDFVVLGAGDDSAVAAGGNDTIIGGKGNDSLDAGDGDDEINSGEGDDYVNGERGTDTVDAGDGRDTVYGSEFVSAGEGDDYVSADDYLSSTPAEKVHLNGGPGRDRLWARALHATVLGGPGNDSISVRDNETSLLLGGAGADQISGGDGDDTIFGGSGNDRISGSSGHDEIHGQSGRDSLWGYTGRDTLIGGSGDDYLDGGDGADSLVAGEGNDVVFGGRGPDTLNGGDGRDLLSASHSAPTITHTRQGRELLPPEYPAIVAAWRKSEGDYTQRVSETREELPTRLSRADTSVDVFVDSDGLDWLLADSELDLFQLEANEILDELE